MPASASRGVPTVTAPPPTGSVRINGGAPFTVSATVNLALSATDPYGVATMQFSTDDATWTEWEPFAAAKTMTLPPEEGPKAVYFRFKNSAGGISPEYSATISLDATPPNLQLSCLKDKAATYNDTLNVTGLLSDLSGIQSLTINGSAVQVAEDGRFSTALRLFSGPNTVTTSVTDKAGHTTSDTRSILLDVAAPLLAISAPADNSTTAKSFLEVTGTIDPGSTVEVAVNEDSPQLAAIADTGASFSATVNLAKGINTVTVTATDLNGKKTTAKRTVFSDDAKASLAILAPNQDLTWPESSITIQGAVADALTAVTITAADGSESYTREIPADAPTGAFQQQFILNDEKPYTITVTATDQAGTTTSTSRNVVHVLGKIMINNGARENPIRQRNPGPRLPRRNRDAVEL